jgi:hypothetical protein
MGNISCDRRPGWRAVGRRGHRLTTDRRPVIDVFFSRVVKYLGERMKVR